MNRNKLRQGIEERVSYSHLLGRVDVMALLEDLGIDFSHRVGASQLMCHCPNLTGNHANGDANPSFGFKEDKLIYGCFVCGGGTILELIQMMNPSVTSDEGALQYLEQFADFNLSKEDFTKKIRDMMYNKEEEEVMSEYPVSSLFQYRKIHPYLLNRGISKDAIIEMQVGYDDDHASIVIPHFFMGSLVGIQKRHIMQDAEGRYLCPNESCLEMKVVPKYKNTPNFPKINTLYGYDTLKEYISKDEQSSAIVVESPLSVLKLKSLGFNRVVATFGQFNKEQASLLWPIEKVYYWADSDSAGKKNLLTAIDALKDYVDLRIVPVLPNLKGDPGDLEATSEVNEYLKYAYPWTLFSTYSKDELPTLDRFRPTI